MVYHVRITCKSRRIHDLVELDLTKEDLTKNIINPYQLGKNFYCNGTLTDPLDVETIKINETSQDSSILLPIIQERKRNSRTAVLGISDEWYVTKEGKDVTRDFIKSPLRDPKYSLFAKIKLQPFVKNICIIIGSSIGFFWLCIQIFEKLKEMFGISGKQFVIALILYSSLIIASVAIYEFVIKKSKEKEVK